jgi:3-isopropylmalate/(R)-2-methylmalate dehydratase small subunit
MESMKYHGRAWKYQDNVSTDHILPSRFMTQVEPRELAAHCMAGLDADFASSVRAGDILVAGYNLGYGSSREQAPRALLYSGIKAVVARTFARIFYRNCYNIGLPAIICPEFVDEASSMDEVEVDLPGGIIRNGTLGKTYAFVRPPEFLLDFVREGGLIPHILKDGRQGGQQSPIRDNTRRLV